MAGPIERSPTGKPIRSSATGKLVVKAANINPGSTGVVPQPTLGLTVNTPSGVRVGSFILLNGSYVGPDPAGVDYSVDGGVSWTPAHNFHAAGGIWSGVGPPATVSGPMTILVRNTTSPSVAATTAGFSVT
jgi:hypothetical protein